MTGRNLAGGKGLFEYAFAARLVAVAALLILLGTAIAPSARASAEDADAPLIAYNALLVGDDARARLVVDFDRSPEFSYHYLKDPARLVITLPSTAFGFSADAVAPRGLVSDVRYGATGPGQSRIVLSAREPIQMTLGEVRQEDGAGARLVIDLAIADAARFETLLARQQPATGDVFTDSLSTPVDDDIYVVAVDAGHGGVDTGAVGEDTKTLEKTITLDFARAFARRLAQEPGYEPFLTRDSDIYLSLSRRVELARQHGADLFISFHADSLDQPDISGATVYTLSDRASDRLAAALARRENLSNEIMGIEADNEPEEVTDILLDLTRRETQSFSISLADRVVASFNGQIGLINNPHRFAGFMVLRAPDIPSILLEIGFLSNAEDERRMLDPEWRDRLVDRLVEAVKRYRHPLVSGGG
ncbi:N-acetylmuramoyl-L-alanine amidase [Martelella lutilitoris]|uniref:N-acetylmuramoyl-L-alanine amidase n=1 Tax=Martelella lutilitoris TaxID=2583532 RepID=A0A5C4JRL4_9HYPH|nr:N-acetylmuramoyl-L-alanine amidase [Martelella lutilitoris]TNB47907.1 N-acetylmuramoyl-L-alanine amidase [Martelella lutilitoris]